MTPLKNQKYNFVGIFKAKSEATTEGRGSRNSKLEETSIVDVLLQSSLWINTCFPYKKACKNNAQPIINLFVFIFLSKPMKGCKHLLFVQSRGQAQKCLKLTIFCTSISIG